ncbi:MAG: HD domain-containing protein [Desulfobacteraceae bacterium]|nr:MAG: HD domain-containing protein [Desulfobacteraceae bacterium]
MLTETEKLNALTNLGIELSKVHDLDILMERILTEARRFVNADAGSIYIREERNLNFSYTQNDTLRKRLKPGEKLIYSTFKVAIDKESIAGYVAETGRSLNLTDVYCIDSALPYKFGSHFDEVTRYCTRSVLTLPLKTAKQETLGVLQVINAQDKENRITSFSEVDERMMLHFASIASVALERAQMTRAILLRMIRMAEMRDPKETGAHVNRVAGYSVELFENWARSQGYSQKEVDRKRDILRMAAMLHDVGKVAISDILLKKPGRFSPEEFGIIKQHTILGARLFSERQSDLDDAAAEVALNHHERWDGKGYPGHVHADSGHPIEAYMLQDGTPRGKREDEIPIFGRIVSLADVFDALSSSRVYKEAWSEEDVLKTIRENAGLQFDPRLVETLFDNLKMIRSIQERYADTA